VSKRLLLTLMVALSWPLAPHGLTRGSAAAAQPPRKTPRSRPASATPPKNPKATATGVPASPRKNLKSNQATKRGKGSAGVLSGSICLIHLFLSDKDSSWTAKEKAEALRRVDVGLAFLKKHAKRYRREFVAIREVLPDVAFGEAIPVDMFAKPSWIDRAIVQGGHGSVAGLVSKLQARHKADHAMILVHVDKRATSYNLSYYRGVRRDFFAERVVMFTRYRDGRATCAASYAHEILHAFGAGELYFPFDTSPERKNRARGHFPNDVMFRVDYRIDRLTIGDYTAYRVGWMDKLDQKYKVFQDPG